MLVFSFRKTKGVFYSMLLSRYLLVEALCTFFILFLYSVMRKWSITFVFYFFFSSFINS